MNRPNWIGQLLGNRYKIQEILGQGGMSTVYKALDPNLQRVVAIKMIHPHLSNDPKFTARFEEEARAVARLRHPNIVQVYDFNHDEDLYYMVQEFVPGETIQAALRRLNQAGEHMQLTDAIKYTIDVCNAIGYAHQFGIIHRDIKPANIMIDERNQAILMDFGIVKLMEGEAHTTTGAVVGTVIYMPPELIRGERPDQRSDLYSLGVTLFEMLSGKPPFEANSAMTLMMMHQNNPVPDIRQLRPDIPEDLIAVVRRSLAKSRDDRFSSAPEMAAALKKIYDRMTRSQSLSSTRLGPADEPVPGQPASGVAPPVTTQRVGSGQPTPGPGGGTAWTPNNPAGTNPNWASGVNSNAGPAGGYSSTGYTGQRPPGGTNVTGQTGVSRPRTLTPLLAGGGVAVILLGVVCLLVIGIGLRNMMANGGGSVLGALAGSTATSSATVTEVSTPTNPPPTETPTSVPATEAPTSIPATPTVEVFPTATVPPGIHFVRINDVQLDSQGHYVVDYETFEYTEQLPGEHVHFFFNSVSQDQAGVPGIGPWILYSGPRPFTQYRAVDRPEDAWQMCALVANSNHSVQPMSGVCYPLPDVTQARALTDTPCLFGPGEEYPVESTLKAFDSRPAEGLSQDEGWWYIDNPEKPGSSCWVPVQTTELIGNIATLQLVEAPPMPTGGAPAADALFAEIKNITIDDQNRYVVEYDTINFDEQLPGTHLHFFFDTTPPEQTGMSGGGSRLMFGGPTPFTGYNVTDRPQEATKMCVLMANPDHSVIPESGNCFPLPDLAPGFVSSDTKCYDEPDNLSASVDSFSGGAEVILLGASPDQKWLYVSDADSVAAPCWVQTTAIKLEGDPNELPVIGGSPALAPTATQGVKKEPKEPNY
jgi:serine/threonine protein kinase